MEACVSARPSSTFLIASAIVSAERFATLFTSDVNSSQVSLSSNLVVSVWESFLIQHSLAQATI